MIVFGYDIPRFKFTIQSAAVRQLCKAERSYFFYFGTFLRVTFNIFDNVNLSKENLESEISKYEVGSVFYKRDILGERCTAEGIVFKDFAEHTEKYIIGADKLPKRFRWSDAGFDIGGNGSAYSMCCSALGYDNVLYVLKAKKKQAPELPMAKVQEYVFGFLDDVESKYNIRIDTVNCDHSDVVINTLNEKRYIFAKTYKPPLEGSFQ